MTLTERLQQLANRREDEGNYTDRNICERAIARIEELENATHNIITAWEILPGGREYSSKEIEKWLIEYMKPAIDNTRNVLKTMEKTNG